MLLVWQILICDQNMTMACQPKREESSRIQEECILLIWHLFRKQKVILIIKLLKWDILEAVEHLNVMALSKLTVAGSRRELRCEEAFAQIPGTSCRILIIKT